MDEKSNTDILSISEKFESKGERALCDLNHENKYLRVRATFVYILQIAGIGLIFARHENSIGSFDYEAEILQSVERSL